MSPFGSRFSPSGSKPDTRLQPYGVAPPEARSCLEKALPTVAIPRGDVLKIVRGPGPPPVAGYTKSIAFMSSW